MGTPKGIHEDETRLGQYRILDLPDPLPGNEDEAVNQRFMIAYVASQIGVAADEIEEYANLAAFPVVGVANILYLALDTRINYIWTGSAYATSVVLALGETSGTAYRGDRGKTAFDHSQLVSGNPHNSTTADVADSLNKRYVSDADLIDINNLSGVNSGNETVATAGTLINGAAAKATPVDADLVPISDSADSFNLRKVTWANIKATLKTYFDSLTTTLTNKTISAGIFTDGATFSGAVRGSQTVLTSVAASIATNFNNNNDFTHTLTENTTLSNPTNIVVGQSGSIFFTQDAVTPRLLSFDSFYKFTGGTVPALTAVASAKDTLDYKVRSATFIECSLRKAIS